MPLKPDLPSPWGTSFLAQAGCRAGSWPGGGGGSLSSVQCLAAVPRAAGALCPELPVTVALLRSASGHQL